ncbi:hypothetical protein RSP673_012540 [Ralstonia solanacearum P673]|uniref:hypothetical protein n=1 Tax=Ralstonia solanacearum species complex TaxID=3116862 RepID=UPI000447818D|nr:MULTISPECIES: hypothetical protein [Ralstonia solanacearum species complex]EUJ11823.1 hypothetical protein RSP673_24240 [Ralstonia solanacearum P673]MCL9852079.1 hypothetical protein [Ralstonia solanacearum]MCL9856975.1 hypothetical protein [Ralstonia solanacearum]MCL9859734.1 hypothetical protein [Ralstonia solanacearum]MCL9866586.1 hypothetical protein [Ralstonia solanacearum]
MTERTSAAHRLANGPFSRNPAAGIVLILALFGLAGAIAPTCHAVAAQLVA